MSPPARRRGLLGVGLLAIPWQVSFAQPHHQDSGRLTLGEGSLSEVC